MNIEYDEHEEQDHDYEPPDLCHYCHGNGFGVVGLDWDCDDGVNGPFDGETEVCPCCHGSGQGKDETFW